MGDSKQNERKIRMNESEWKRMMITEMKGNMPMTVFGLNKKRNKKT